MKINRIAWFTCLALAVSLFALQAQPQPAKIIFDTDMDTDCDDTAALALLHALADQQEAEILATVVSSHFPWSPACVDAINRYYQRAALPIAAPKQPGASTHRGSRYAEQIAQRFLENPQTTEHYPDAVPVYREVLAQQPPRSVTIVTVGYLTNLAYLLDSEPDQHSPLDGRQLVAKTVDKLVCMGGRYPRHLNPGEFGNFKPDPDAAVQVAEEWPTQVIFTGLGDDVYTGESLQDTPDDNPVKVAYRLFLGDRPARNSWDLFAVLYAVRPQQPFWLMQKEGYNHIFDNGTNEWRDTNQENHWLLKVDPNAKDDIKATMNELIALPPQTP